MTESGCLVVIAVGSEALRQEALATLANRDFPNEDVKREALEKLCRNLSDVMGKWGSIKSSQSSDG